MQTTNSSLIFLLNFQLIKSRNRYNTNFIMLQLLLVALLDERILANKIFFVTHQPHQQILARPPVFSTSIDELNPVSSPSHGFRSCITVEGNLVDGNPLFLMVFVARAVHNTQQIKLILTHLYRQFCRCCHKKLH